PRAILLVGFEAAEAGAEARVHFVDDAAKIPGRACEVGHHEMLAERFDAGIVVDPALQLAVLVDPGLDGLQAADGVLRTANHRDRRQAEPNGLEHFGRDMQVAGNAKVALLRLVERHVGKGVGRAGVTGDDQLDTGADEMTEVSRREQPRSRKEQPGIGCEKAGNEPLESHPVPRTMSLSAKTLRPTQRGINLGRAGPSSAFRRSRTPRPAPRSPGGSAPLLPA